MKVATLTLPFHTNYGAALQAFALQKKLIELGCDTDAIDVSVNSLRPLHRVLLSKLKSLLIGSKERRTLYGNKAFDVFFINEIRKTKKLEYSFHFKRKDVQNYDLYLVGSDQVWRPEYVTNINRFFFDFIDGKKVSSYAASFGLNYWPFSEAQTRKCKKLISKFENVSVRESNGINMCNEYFSKESELVLDPTFIIKREYYDELISKYSGLNTSEFDTFCYVLDMTSEKRKLIESVSTNAYICSSSVQSDESKIGIGCWLKGIRDSNFIITDSFHGLVFSIIFKKNFCVIGNTKRGIERFKSLLERLGLEDRLILDTELENLSSYSTTNIDYKKVDEILSVEIDKSTDYIKKLILK